MTLILLAAVTVLAGPPSTAAGSAAGQAGSEPAAVELASTVAAAPHARQHDWTFPVPGRPWVVRGFAPGPARWSAGHRGVDLAGVAGVAVVAAGAGRVSFAAEIAGVGVIVVDHGHLRTTYQPVASRVAEGTVVRSGQPLGRLAQRGSHCAAAACLHWGLLRGPTYLDPLSLVAPPRIRLLPFDRPLAGQARPG